MTHILNPNKTSSKAWSMSKTLTRNTQMTMSDIANICQGVNGKGSRWFLGSRFKNMLGSGPSHVCVLFHPAFINISTESPSPMLSCIKYASMLHDAGYGYIQNTYTHWNCVWLQRGREEIAVPTRCFSALTPALATLCSKAVEMIRLHTLPRHSPQHLCNSDTSCLTINAVVKKKKKNGVKRE